MSSAAASRRNGFSSWTVAGVAFVAAFAGYSVASWRAARSTAAVPERSVEGRVGADIPRDLVRSPAASQDVAGVEQRRQELAAHHYSPRAERELATELTALARTDPATAMRIAHQEPNWRLQAEFCRAVLRGWAEVEPVAATEAALAFKPEERALAMAAVFDGAARAPDEAKPVAALACDRDPERAADYGAAVIASLSKEGAFAEAAAFVRERPSSPLRLELGDSAFVAWAEHDPAAASAALNSLTDPELREAAAHGLMVGWARADPVAASNFAANLPAGEARAAALANAVPRWLERDPLGAVTWLSQRELGPDFDIGVVAVANAPGIVSHRPELAMTLAQSITDAALRTNTLRTLALKWAESDGAAASRYVEASTNFPAAERESILSEIRSRPGG